MPIDYAALFAAIPAPCLILSSDLRICEVNGAYLAATSRSREELVGLHVFEAFPDTGDPATDQEDLRASLQHVLRTGEPHVMTPKRYDIAVQTDAGRVIEERWWLTTNSPLHDGERRAALIINRVEDVTERERVRVALERSERRFRSLVEHAADAILVVGAEREVTYASPATSRVLGRPVAVPPDFRWGDCMHPDDLDAALEVLDRARATDGKRAVSEPLRVLRPDGSVRYTEVRATDHGDDKAIGGVVVNVRDVTERRLVERTLQQQAMEDALTATPNRRWFLEAATGACARAARNGNPVALVLIDVDHFKLVNDTMGHPAGDRLLIELVRRVAGALRPSDTVARLGGDEFAIFSEDLRTEQDAWQIAQRIAEAATGRYELGPAQEARITLSIGVSTDQGTPDADTLLAHADAALYKAKRDGRNRIEVFDPELRRVLVHRIEVENELHHALRNDELLLHWQPIVTTGDGTVIGAEALLRWEHPRRGLLGPADFMPIAEEAGLMDRVGAWAIDRAFAQAVTWQHLDPPPRVFVNLAAEQMMRGPSFAEEVAELAAAHGVRPEGICFEVSERSLDADLIAIREQLHLLRTLGFGLALDDFGAGNTALTWLQQLPLDVLKLDRRFVSSIEDPIARAIMQAIVQLGPTLGVASVAEGVETLEQFSILHSLGCDFAQGFQIGEPQSALAVTRHFEQRTADTPRP